MSYNYLIIIFIGIGVLAAVSIFFGIVNWINLASTSSAINRLQSDIEKKYQEHDSQKKNSPAPVGYTAPVSAHSNQPMMQAQTPQSQPVATQEPKQERIEVVRNVRGGYTVTEIPNLTQENIPMQQDTVPESRETEETTSAQQQPVSSQATPNITHTTVQPSTPIPDNSREEVLEVVGESKTNAPVQQPTSDTSITIPLYSQANQDADFNTLWNKLKQTLTTSPHLQINIDFKDVLFLYDKEIEYLQKIHKTVEIHQGKLSFIHCSLELAAILGNDPQLKNLIVKES